MKFYEYRLTERFGKAFQMALELHQNQLRKNTHAPFMTHLLAVSSLVCENIGFLSQSPKDSEDAVIIAMLHDTIEDQGGMHTYHRLKSEFGKTIADGVLALSDSTPDTPDSKPSKAERNAVYREKLRHASPEIALISCCDKIHNLRTMASDYLVAPTPDVFWGAFSASPHDTVANYEKLGEIYHQQLNGHRILTLFDQALSDVTRILP